MSKEDKFESFGYKSNDKCLVCESTDTRIEPNYYYSVCIKHFEIPPVKLQNKDNEL